jgi:hypothetical protein
MAKFSAQISSGNVVVGVLSDSLGRIPEGNIELNVEDPNSIIGYKYDSSAEENPVKTSLSFSAPPEDKFYDNEGVEQDLPT